VGNSPQSYANIPVLLAANNCEEKRQILEREGKTLNQLMKNVPPCPWSRSTENQQKVFEKLKNYEF